MANSETDLQIDPKILARAKRLELRTRRRIDADLIGSYRSAFRGSGLVFSDVREYQPGDDVKHIHWKVTARSQQAYVKSYEEDRQLQIMLVVDSSASTQVASGGGTSMRERIAEFATFLTLLARSNGDGAGLCLFGRGTEAYLPIRSKSTHFQRLLYEILRHREAAKKSDLAACLKDLSQTQRRSAIIFILSDFFTTDYQLELKALSTKHDVICVAFEETIRKKLPKVGLLGFSDAETGANFEFDASSTSNLNYLSDYQSKHLKELTSISNKAGADLLLLGKDPIRSLTQFMQQRQRRR